MCVVPTCDYAGWMASVPLRVVVKIRVVSCLLDTVHMELRMRAQKPNAQPTRVFMRVHTGWDAAEGDQRAEGRVR